MEAATLKHLEGIIAANAKPLDGVTDIPAMLVPESAALHSLEHLLENPTRFRGVFTTSHIAYFLEYIKENRGAGTQIFLNPKKMSAVAVFDLFDDLGVKPAWGSHMAIIELDKSSEYTALLEGNGQHFSQRSFIDWIRDWMHCIEFFAEEEDKGEAISINKVIQEIQRLEVKTGSSHLHEEGEFRRSRSAMEEIEIKSQGGLPAVMRMDCKPYDEIPEQQFTCRLQAFSDGKTLSVGYRIQALEKMQNDIREEFRAMIEQSDQADGLPLYIGTFTNKNTD